MLLVGHSMGGLLCIEYAGREDPPPVAGFIAASCTSIPRGLGLRTYRVLARGFDSLPDRGMWLTNRMLDRILPDETRADFGAGGYALDAQDVALRSLSVLDLLAALHRIEVPLWFVNGQYDQLRVNERLFMRVAQHAELIVVPRTTHHVTVMRPRVFNALLDLAIATIASRRLRDRATPDRLGDWLACGSLPSRPPCDIPLLPLGISHRSLRTKDRSTNVANIKSQIKRNKTNDKAHERNKAVKSELRTEVRRTREAIAAGDKAAAEKSLAKATKKLDKAASKGVIHENQAANRKSAIAKQVAAL